MAKSFAAAVVETSQTIGNGTYELAGAVIGHRTFEAAGFVTGDKPYYVVRNRLNTKYEFNKNAIYTNTTVDTLARGTWLSSNSNNPVVWATQDLPLTIYIPSAEELLEYLWQRFTGTEFLLPKTCQRTYFESNTIQSTTTAIPYDNTVPQISEGVAVTAFTAVAVAIKSATSKVKIRLHLNCTPSATDGVAAAVFINAVANALATNVIYAATTSGIFTLVVEREIANPGVGNHTFSVRFGNTGGGSTVRLNSQTGSGFYGNNQVSTFEVEEWFQ